MFNFKNGLIVVLALAAGYLGWMQFAVADNNYSVNNNDHGFTFQYANASNCNIVQAPTKDSTNVADTKSTIKTSFLTDEVDCQNNEMMKGIQIDKTTDDNGNDTVRVNIICCQVNQNNGYYHN